VAESDSFPVRLSPGAESHPVFGVASLVDVDRGGIFRFYHPIRPCVKAGIALLYEASSSDLSGRLNQVTGCESAQLVCQGKIIVEFLILG
jgi:hypothetical protein